jgi:hypothetical protein
MTMYIVYRLHKLEIHKYEYECHRIASYFDIFIWPNIHEALIE